MLMKFIRFKEPYSRFIKKWGMLGMKKYISSVLNENYPHEVFRLTLRKS